MKIKIIFIMNLLFLGLWLNPVFADVHSQKNGLFSMDIPSAWHWNEFPEEIVIAYPDGKEAAIDIQFVATRVLSRSDIMKILKEGVDKMIKEGIEAHKGILIDNKEVKLDGVYARQLDFDPTPQEPIHVTYISFFNKGYAFTITYGSGDEKMRSVMEDAVATFQFNKF